MGKILKNIIVNQAFYLKIPKLSKKFIIQKKNDFESKI